MAPSSITLTQAISPSLIHPGETATLTIVLGNPPGSVINTTSTLFTSGGFAPPVSVTLLVSDVAAAVPVDSAVALLVASLLVGLSAALRVRDGRALTT